MLRDSFSSMEPVNSAEQALELAALAGRLCDFRTPAEKGSNWTPGALEAGCWSEDRVIRSDYIAYLMTELRLPVSIRGARVDGRFILEGPVRYSQFGRVRCHDLYRDVLLHKEYVYGIGIIC